MQTLPDLLDKKVTLLSIGLNPSLPSVQAGFYFANPRNRFWKAINNSGLHQQALTPSLKSCFLMLEHDHIGFTDLVKRPTAGGKDLKANDYRLGSTRLQQLIKDIQPDLLWFHGKMTCQKYLQYSSQKHLQTRWGFQTWRLLNSSVYISPNPSPANAAFSLDTISDSYRDLFLHQGLL